MDGSIILRCVAETAMKGQGSREGEERREKNVRKYLLESPTLFDTHDRQRRGCSLATSGELVKRSLVFPHLYRKDKIVKKKITRTHVRVKSFAGGR